MTYFHYYATTSRNLDRVMQYGVFPVAKAAWLVALSGMGDTKARIAWASDLARVTSAVVYSGLTTAFLGAESEMIDENAKKALSAELGVDTKKLSFSDYKYSKNAIISTAYNDIIRLQKYRYGTDALFMMPIGLRAVSKATGIPWIEHSREVNNMIENGEKIGFGSMMVSGHNAWDFSVLAGKAGYWAGETYFVDKSGHYEVVKLIENLRSTGKDLSTNDLLGVYQRTRNVDMHLPFIERPEEYDALRPLLKKMADACNKHDGKFGVPEMVYLFGLGKVNIHADDKHMVSQDAVKRSEAEIDKVINIGLDGIREENRKKHEAEGLREEAVLHSKSFVDKLGDRAVNAAQNFSDGLSKMVFGLKPRRHEEVITSRDPGELENWDRGINR
ncbi:MAG: hypothetical protein ACK502_09300 [Alphaproteobacteria bacterium]